MNRWRFRKRKSRLPPKPSDPPDGMMWSPFKGETQPVDPGEVVSFCAIRISKFDHSSPEIRQIWAEQGFEAAEAAERAAQAAELEVVREEKRQRQPWRKKGR